MSGLLSGPALFVVFLSVLFLLFPAAYLWMMIRDRRPFRKRFS